MVLLLSSGSRQSGAIGGLDYAAASGAGVGSSSASGQEGKGDDAASIVHNDPKFMIASRVAMHLLDGLASARTPEQAEGPAGGIASGGGTSSVGLSSAASVRVAT